ncbi:hypothetical protein AA106555_0526 [Neokomagataea thailandica NBRC 106555]|uniref:Uncharacterized protein n=1 Tax=Neokomagataea thailandica NBRC 106555 TaxID=1223520 RepID=A0ABQ0QND4_9PROT|nr:hypothetical protein AA106555_0526 [Neokomagataea thailandica NBRC 106555]
MTSPKNSSGEGGASHTVETSVEKKTQIRLKTLKPVLKNPTTRVNEALWSNTVSTRNFNSIRAIWREMT